MLWDYFIPVPIRIPKKKKNPGIKISALFKIMIRHFLWNSRSRDFFLTLLKPEHPEEIRKLVDRYANFKRDSLVQYLDAMKNRPATTGVLESITKPVLFIMGEEDKAVPIKDSLEQCHLPRISYIHILTRTAHMGMIENTSLCNSIVDRIPVSYSCLI